jgi:hypothetical protein
MKTNYTKGPWIAQPDPDACAPDDWVVGTDAGIDSVCVCREQDAHLIAAAPELLEALQKLVDMPAKCFGRDMIELLEIRKSARAATAKAQPPTGGLEP